LFNDIEMDATPNSDTYKGLSGNLRADEKGVVRASFLVPSNTRCGTVNVKIFTEDYPTLIGSTPFTANGTLKKTINTVTTTTHVVNTIYRERVYP
ncbi:MAG: hypothetical protein Q4Q13_07280, partial [Vagococcus sp.]|nr:hypothetical protein [Vagococcus sp.]